MVGSNILHGCSAKSNSIYTVFRKDRGDGYGGVAIFVKPH